MDLDVIYKIDTGTLQQNIKKYIQQRSIKLALCSAPKEIFEFKKIFWSTINKLKDNGAFCIFCNAENISNIINVISDNGYDYTIKYFYNNDRIFICLIVYNILPKFKFRNIVRIDSWRDIVYCLMSLTNYRDIILLINDDVLTSISICKKMSRYVIGFGENNCINFGIQGVRVNDLSYLQGKNRGKI